MMYPPRLPSLVLSALMAGLAAACDGGSPPPAATVAAPPAAPPAAAPAPASPPAAVAVAPAPVFDEAFLRNEPKRYSQFREEVVIRYHFRDRKGGFFLDVGAAEWQKSSTTLYLESELGWSGIAIDARPELAKEYAEHRPRTRFFSYLVTDHSGAKEKFYLAGRLSSGNKDHLKQFANTEGARPMEVEVPSITLDDLLAREKVEHIDFMNMDIEGFEPPALAGFDIDRYQPVLVCIESAPKTKGPILEYFAAHGYRRMDEYLPYDSVNWYFEKKR